ncbi:hypothetical protein AUEXF2481DRAFT_605361 [Aureobasidium subglaciale EXF-2481]|uniref:Uncharacterized protein n=1 Tax=Aureobasidium subglaciale (strain EXF-2481) TaxID=1043005 RepID=A0A074YIF4_AURSE|nr:uncharacterized protein AUEXF2481DRAFT_605361 [Aureobasidium subglaciale EXF-2481]KAI5199011.1 hypothetical protein E4T38_07212 [Aureobasidium subglaciale]KAI5217768.1 hypothetical protein E4T40_07223 [Aureobasidium subglaciale]KAI5220694.1 hypothetical protein E4T41_07377 [Aureobasidium subglaciale]KAI5258396.1 hypothetical protein E4T46_07354 [Aureobasidium subglaciale]KEQ97588.1 hypothetical protein AUEXF2481DRAFT_605361 [Aureobasidium subglaciale EXF-2481]
MSQLSQHRQRGPSLGIIASSYGLQGQPPVPNARPSPLSSHPPTPVEPVGGSCSNEQHHSNSQQQQRVAEAHSREVSSSSLPFGSPSNSFPRKHPSNFSTPDLSKSASPSTDSLFHQDTNSFAGSSSQLHQLPLAYQLNNQSTSSKLDLSNFSTMSSQDNHRHDSFGSQLPVPKGPTNNGRRRSISMQKLFSLTNLKSSFTNSRTSLVSTPSSQHPPQTASSDRPSSNSTNSSRGVKRAAEEDFVVVKPGQDNLQPPLRKRKSSSWFSRRKSGLFSFNSYNANSSAVVDDYDMPQGPDAMMMDEPELVRPTTEHTLQSKSNSSSERPASVYTTHTTQLPPMLPPLSPMSKTQTQSSQYSQPPQAQRPQSHRTFSSQSRVSRSSSQRRTPYSPSAREAFSPPPTLPELTRIETSFGDSDMGELFAHIGR